MGTVFTHGKPLVVNQHPSARNGDQSSEDGVWLPMWRVVGYPCGVWLVTHVTGYCFQATRAVLSLCGMHLLISVQDRVTHSVQDRVTHSVQDRVTQCSLSNATTIVWGELTGPWNAFVNQCTVPGDPQCSLGNATTVVMGLWNGLMECIC